MDSDPSVETLVIMPDLPPAHYFTHLSPSEVHAARAVFNPAGDVPGPNLAESGFFFAVGKSGQVVYVIFIAPHPADALRWKVVECAKDPEDVHGTDETDEGVLVPTEVEETWKPVSYESEPCTAQYVRELIADYKHRGYNVYQHVSLGTNLLERINASAVVYLGRGRQDNLVGDVNALVLRAAIAPRLAAMTADDETKFFWEHAVTMGAHIGYTRLQLKPTRAAAQQRVRGRTMRPTLTDVVRP